MMNHYITPDNKKWGFDDTQTDLIPKNAILIPESFTLDQIPYLDLLNGVVSLNQDNYKSYLIRKVKAQVDLLLTATDWVEIPSVSNVSNTPHLINYSDFISYRLALRAIAVSPTINPILPIIPIEQWSS
jgi:hypothetical protein